MAITAKRAIEAIKGSRGFITTVANRLGCSRMNVYLLMQKYPTVKQAILDEKDEMKDFAEAQLFQNIKDGKETSLIFYLKTQGKDRGYIEKQEISLLVEQELEKALDTLEKELPPDVYSAVITALAGEDS